MSSFGPYCPIFVFPFFNILFSIKFDLLNTSLAFYTLFVCYTEHRRSIKTIQIMLHNKFIRGRSSDMKNNTFTILLAFLSFVLQGQSHFSKSLLIPNGSGGNKALNIQSTDTGNLILAARVSETGNEYAALANISSTGDIILGQNFYAEDQGYSPDPGLNMVINDTCIFLACQYYNGDANLDLQMLCIEKTSLDTLWTKSYTRPLDDYILQILETEDNNLVMVSAAKIASNRSNLRLTKTDKSGNIIWDHFFDDFKTYYPWQATTTEGGILVAYGAFSFGAFYKTGVLSKFNTDGEEVWTRTFLQTESNTLAQVTALHNGDIAFGWVKDTFPPGGILYQYPPTVWILDSMGNTKSVTPFYHRYIRSLTTLRTLPDGNILGIGEADGHPDSFGTGGWLFKMAPDGQLLWQRTIFDQNYLFGGFYDAVFSPSDEVVAVGYGFTKTVPVTEVIWLFKMGVDGCYGSDCNDMELLITPASEAPLQDTRYSLYPNPATNDLYIDGWTGTEERWIEVFNQSGQLVRSLPAPATGHLNIGDLPLGMYSLKITLKDNYFTTLMLIKP